MAVAGCVQKRRVARLVLGVQLRPLLQKVPHDLRVTLAGGVLQRALVAANARVGVRALGLPTKRKRKKKKRRSLGSVQVVVSSSV